MTRPIPDRLAADPKSAFHVKDMPMVRISIDGAEVTGRVLEYCISKRWARVIKTDEEGKPLPGARPGHHPVRVCYGTIMVWLAGTIPPDGAIDMAMPQPKRIVQIESRH